MGSALSGPTKFYGAFTFLSLIVEATRHKLIRMSGRAPLLSDKQFTIAVIAIVLVVAFIYSLAWAFSITPPAGNGGFGFQLSDIVGIVILNGIQYAPYVLFPAAFISFLSLNSKKSKNWRWPVTILCLGFFCLVIRLLLWPLSLML